MIANDNEKIDSSYYKDIFFTYLLSKTRSTKGTIVLLDGIPSNPQSKNKLLKDLFSKNYDVFFPRYEGTFESKGEFLKRNPGEGISEFIDSLRKGIKLKNEEYKANTIFILGSSFGGAVGIDIAGKKLADKVCLLSPVVSFRSTNSIHTLESYLNDQYSDDYRFDSKNWEKLIEDKILNLKLNKTNTNSNILIITGKNDDQINVNDVISFTTNTHIEAKVYDGGHISLSKITASIMKDILDFFSETYQHH